MSQTTVSKVWKVDSIPTDPTSITIHVTRTDTGADVVTAGTAMTKTVTGSYYHTWTDPAASLTYEWTITLVYSGQTFTFEGTAVGGSADTTDLYDLIDFIRPYLKGATDGLIKHTLNEVYCDFCRDTQIWLATLATFPTVADQAAYTLTLPANTVLERIYEVKVDGVVAAYTIDESNSLTLDSTPATAGLDIDVKVILFPTDQSATLPSWFFERWRYALRDGVIRKLAKIPNTTFTNYQLAAEKEVEYRKWRGRARREARLQRRAGGTIRAKARLWV